MPRSVSPSCRRIALGSPSTTTSRCVYVISVSISARRTAAGRVGAFKIRVARFAGDASEANSLVRKLYEGKGYLTSATQVTTHSCTFSAYDEGRLSGTVSLRLDSDEGLAADELYDDEMRALRAQGQRFASSRGWPWIRHTFRIRARRVVLRCSCSRRSSAVSTTW
jgi:hypothetical protein